MQNYVSYSGRTDEEMLFTNFKYNVTEGSRSNILSVKDSTLFYTDPGVSYLSGIIQKHIIADHKKIGFKKCESVKGGFSYDFLHECNCAIMTNSLVISKDYSSICFEKDILKFKPSGISEKIRDFYLK